MTNPSLRGPAMNPLAGVWRRRRRRLPGQRGSVTILAAGVLLLSGVLALATVDLLRALEAKATAQTAADAAALAAAQEIALSSSEVPAEAAADYARLNGATLLECRCPSGGSEAVVRVEVPVRLVFVGRDRTVTGRARAVIEGR
jgi:secretion/DNA translocation related TadE-like protein